MFSLPIYVLTAGIDASNKKVKSCSVLSLKQFTESEDSGEFQSSGSDLNVCLSKLGLSGSVSFQTVKGEDGEVNNVILEIDSVSLQNPRIIVFDLSVFNSVDLKFDSDGIVFFTDPDEAYSYLIILPQSQPSSNSSGPNINTRVNGLFIPPSEIGIFYLPGDAVVYNGKTFKVLGGFPVVKNTSGDVIYVYALSDVEDNRVRVLVPESFLKLPS